MTLRFLLATVLLTTTLVGCLSPQTEEQGLVQISDQVRSTPQYRQAEKFDAFLKDTLSPEEKKKYIHTCTREKTDDIFCFSVAREKKLRRFLAKELKASIPSFRKKPDPITPSLAGNRVKNWSKMQKADLKALLAGMRSLSLEDLRKIGNYALKRAECPNHISVATAALLEMHLPFEDLAPQIAQLYEKGARCTRRRSANHEHYLTRAGLFWYLIQQYPKAEKVLSRIEPTDAFSGRALYWLYRVQQKMGKQAAADRSLRRLKTQLPLSFHALMVQSEQGQDPIGTASAEPPPTRSKINPSVNPVISQAERLHEYAFIESATKLANWALAVYTPREHLVRAYISTLGDASTQIKTIGTLLVTKPQMRNATYYKLAYPPAYLELFSQHSGEVDPFLLLAVARKESTMNPKAVSPANAQGLLQLNPETARKMWGSDAFDLFDPKTNAEIAVRYIKELQSKMRGQLPLIIASYNAGENTVANWTQRYPTHDLLLFVDLIPYRETRDYVGFVLSNYFWYRRLYGKNAGQGLVGLSTGQVAKVDDLDGDRSIKSVPEEPITTGEQLEADQSESGNSAD